MFIKVGQLIKYKLVYSLVLQMPMPNILVECVVVVNGPPRCEDIHHFIHLFYFYFYPPDSQESDGGANAQGNQLPQPTSGNAKILLRA